MNEKNDEPHKKMPDIEKDRDIGENAPERVLHMATIIHHGHLGVGNSEEGKSTLESGEHLLDFGIELCLAESLGNRMV